LDESFPVQSLFDVWLHWNDGEWPLSQAPNPASAPAPG
jgi:hypothetical protein